MSKEARLELDGKVFTLPTVEGTEVVVSAASPDAAVAAALAKASKEAGAKLGWTAGAAARGMDLRSWH